MLRKSRLEAGNELDTLYEKVRRNPVQIEHLAYVRRSAQKGAREILRKSMILFLKNDPHFGCSLSVVI